MTAARFEKPGNRFNERIQNVRIVKSALTAKGIRQLSAEKTPKALRSIIVAVWDFVNWPFKPTKWLEIQPELQPVRNWNDNIEFIPGVMFVAYKIW